MRLLFLLLCASGCLGFQLHGGIQAMISQKGLDYIGKVAEKGVPKIFDGLKIPDQEGSGYAIKNLELYDVSRSKVVINFDENDNGIVSNATISAIKVKGHYTAGWGWLSTSGNMTANITDLSFASTLKLLVGVDGIPVVNITTCKAHARNILADFKSKDTIGGAITSFKDVIEAFLLSSIDWIICSSAQTAVSEYADMMINPPGGVVPTAAPGEAFVLCEEFGQPGAQPADVSANTGMNMGGLVPLPLPHLYLNMSMTGEPDIQSSGMDLAFNGSFTYEDHQSRTNHPKRDQLRGVPHNHRMVRMVVSEMVANSFFEQLRSNTLEKVCSSCRGNLEAELIRPPEMKISMQNGAWLDVTGWVRTEVTVFHKRIDLFWVDANIMLSARPYVERNRLKAQVTFERLNIESDDRAGRFGRMVGFFLKKTSNIASEIIPKSVIPKLEAKLNKALGSGLPLPKVCGLDFYNTKAYPVDGAVVIDTDIEYNADPILKQFKTLLETPIPPPKK